MFKKFILIFFILIFNLFFVDDIFASYSIPVEDVFSDIDWNYKYLNELQALYDKWMIFPDSEWKFNPKALLNRDEFVWILMEVTCQKCIQPNTEYGLISKYENEKTFFDLENTNKYFYCIAAANDVWYVSWYHPSTKCENWTYLENKKPYCPNNTIILEEAIAVILRASWILTNEEAGQVRQDILDWKITQKLSDDVSPKNLDWSVYSFYPDFRKAIDYEVKEVDKDWNINIYNLVDIIDWKIRPKQVVSKEMFLHIAYVAMRANSCDEKVQDHLALKIKVFDKSCAENSKNCDLSDLNDITNTYDFDSQVETTCEQWVSNPDWYIWRFYNYQDWTQIKKYWKYIDNFKFLSNGKRQVFLRVIDKCWNTGEVYNMINVESWINNTNLRVSIDANPISWNWPLIVDFAWIVSWWKWPYTYSWNFWDWNSWYWKDIENLFKQEWVYKVTLEVTDINGDRAYATVLIQVLSVLDKLLDSDKDGILDIDDLCPLVKWVIENKWCPIHEESCNWGDCRDWYYCDDNNICLPKDVSTSCEYSWWDLIVWNVSCNMCPCNNFLDFISTIRKCDIIFPAITSSDEKEIYSKWGLYEIK